MLETIDLTTARTRGAPYRFTVNGPELRVQSLGAAITLRIRGEEITVTDPQTVVARDCLPLGDVEVTHAAAPAQTAVIFYSTVLSLGKADRSPASAGLELIENWYGKSATNAGTLQGRKGDWEATTYLSNGAGGATPATEYNNAFGEYIVRVQLLAPAGSWASSVVQDRQFPSDPWKGFHPLGAVPAAARKSDPVFWRLNITAHLAALVNSGAVGTDREARACVGYVQSRPFPLNNQLVTGQGVYFVSDAATQTWHAVMAALRGANVPADYRSREYFNVDTGVSCLSPHLLTIQHGWQADGTPLMQFAIDGVIKAQRSGKFAALIDANDFVYGGYGATNDHPGVGFALSATTLNDTLDFYTGYNEGWELFRGRGTLSPGAL